MTSSSVRVSIGRVDGRITHRRDDILAVEEPLEIRVGSKSLSVTMRTPGDDIELAAGFPTVGALAPTSVALAGALVVFFVGRRVLFFQPGRRAS